jgi:hypothetical protein
MRPKIALLKKALIAGCLAAVFAETAAADIVVISSDSEGYKVGQKLNDDATLNIPSCATLVLRSGNKFLTLHGQYEGKLSEYPHGPVIFCSEPSRPLRAPGERESVYDQYFHTICEKQTACDATCKAVFELLTHKEGVKINCAP